MSLWGNKNFYSTSVINNSNNNNIKPDKKFMSMFMGLVDGDGYLEIGPQKQYNSTGVAKSTIRSRLVIRLHSRDTFLLTEIKNILGVGSLSLLKSTNPNVGDQLRLIFSKKDLVTVIIPLIKEYNLKFLTNNRHKQFSLLNYIIDNNIVHWENVDYTPLDLNNSCAGYLLNLNFFAYWIVGFTVAEGSFGFKSRGDAFFQIKQKGIENHNILIAIGQLITDKTFNMKADYTDSYQLSLSSKSDIQKVVNFFSTPDTNLCGYKLIQYNEWLVKLKTSNRYKDTIIPK